jgi:protocatechuate 3,4-dioxygenase beta subunit
MDDSNPTPESDAAGFSRRRALVRLGGLVAGAVGGSAWAAHESLGAEDATVAVAGTSAVATGLLSCVLSPEMTQGPYYLPGDLVRRNVTEGKPGTALRLKLAVIDVTTCRPIRNAGVDIWHCDALGVYSGTATQGTEDETFLRGIQRTDAKGVARFTTLYPGWYQGRTVHIHVKVYLGGRTLHTGQLFFPDALTDIVYRRTPYASRPDRDPRNAGDSIYRNGGSRSLLKLSRSGNGYLGSIAMGVQRA